MPSLLHQLMSGDVFNENSCILQCLKFIVDEELIPIPDHLKKKEKEKEKKEIINHPSQDAGYGR